MSNDKLTEQDIQAMTERCEKATAEPWIDDSHANEVCFADYRLICKPVSNHVGTEKRDANRAFIAHARTDLPACLREIGRLKEAKQIADEALESVKRKHDALFDKLSTLTQKLAELTEELERAKTDNLAKVECCNVMANNFNIIYSIAHHDPKWFENEQCKQAMKAFWDADKEHQSGSCGIEKRYELERLHSKLAELERDAKRLDWLEKNRVTVQAAGLGYGLFRGPRDYWGECLRSAIDIAMTASTPTESGPRDYWGECLRSAIDIAMTASTPTERPENE